MSIYDVRINGVDGSQDVLKSLKGKVSLFVNIASKAGYQPSCSRLWSHVRTVRQLFELEKLHNMFDDFSVVAFPCNQFGKMEPLDNPQICEFIKNNYPFVTFPVTEKIIVNGNEEHEIFKILKGPEVRLKDDNPADTSDAAAAGHNTAGGAMYRIPHNYEKFLVDKNGNVVNRFSWRDMPLATEPGSSGAPMTIIEAIELHTRKRV